MGVVRLLEWQDLGEMDSNEHWVKDIIQPTKIAGTSLMLGTPSTAMEVFP